MRLARLVAAAALLPALLAAAPLQGPPGPNPFAMFREEIVGHRLVGLVFDLRMLPGRDLARAVDTASEYVSGWMGAQDLASVSVLGSSLDTVQDFTTDRGRLVQALGRVTALAHLTGMSGDRLGAMKAMCRGLAGLQQDSLVRFDAGLIRLPDVIEQLTVIYFGSGVMRGLESPVELGGVAAACGQENVVFYMVDARSISDSPPIPAG
jgi:hypothetical protein